MGRIIGDMSDGRNFYFLQLQIHAAFIILQVLLSLYFVSRLVLLSLEILHFQACLKFCILFLGLFEILDRTQGRLKKTWMKVIRQDIEVKGLSEGILLDRNEWVPNPA